MIFADAQGRVLARRWCNRLSTLLAVRPNTAQASIVAEAMHATAAQAVPELIDALTGELQSLWGAGVRSAVLSHAALLFEHAG